MRDKVVTEGTFANAFMVDKNDTLVTKAPSELILQGITRNRLIEIAKAQEIKVEERDFEVAEMLDAKEVFLSSSSLILRPVTKIDGKIIGSGKAGKISKILSQEYKKFIG